AAPAAHLLEIELAAVRAADRAREQLGPARRDDDPAADVEDDLGRLAVGVGRDDHGPTRGQDPVEPARDDVAGEALREADDVDARGRERLRKPLARLVREEADLVRLEQAREVLELRVPRAVPDDRDR